jgi:hypothetical protein
MKRHSLAALVFCSCLFSACSNNGAPDVSGITVDLSLQRFDKDFFAADTNHIEQAMGTVQHKYPWFFNDFMQNIVIGGSTDTINELPVIVRSYISHSRPLFDSVQQKMPNTKPIENDLVQGFRYVKYYFPEYKTPNVVTYVGLIGDPAIAVTKNAIAIGLQMYLGKNFSAYNTPEAIEQFPQYISRRFEPQYIPVNCFQSVASDIYPDKSEGRSLIEQMVEKGKQWWLLNKFMPGVADSLLTGFTNAQVEWCKKNEGLIWNFILQGRDVYSTDPMTIKDFIGEAPKTEGMPDASPGNIGQWVGWKIVEAYAAKNSSLSVPQILQTDAKKLFEEAKYKPR